MEKNARNYAFIDAQNLNLGIQELGWKLDYRKFRRYLREKYAVEVAYMFLGFVTSNQRLYSALQKAGFVLNFKPVVLDGLAISGCPRGTIVSIVTSRQNILVETLPRL